MLQVAVKQLLSEIELRESQVADLKRALAILNAGASVPRNSYAPDTPRSGRANEVYLALKANPDGIRTADLVGDLHKSYATVSSTLMRLKRKGLAESIRPGTWKAIDQGEPSPIVTPAPVVDGNHQIRGKRATIAQYLREHPEGAFRVDIEKELGIKEKTLSSALQKFRTKGLVELVAGRQWVWKGDGAVKSERPFTPSPGINGIGIRKPAPLQDRIYAVVQQHPDGINRAGIAHETGLSLGVVSTSLTPIKDKGLIRNWNGLWLPTSHTVASVQQKQPGGRVQSKIYQAVLEKPQGITSTDLAVELGMGKNTVSSFLSQLAQKGYLRHEGAQYLPN